ncbi:hypothetical protein L6R52_29060 [Myxococcota bacterium]|nr:hypothetical protein [Myxococcota bacterium]
MYPQPLRTFDRAKLEARLLVDATRTAAASRSPEALSSLAALRRALANAHATRYGDHVFFDAFLPRAPGPRFDKFVRAALGLHAPYAPLGLFELDVADKPCANFAHARTHLFALEPDQAGVIAYRGVDLFERMTDLEDLVARANERADAWLVTPGRKLTASKAKRLADHGLAGAAVAISHFDPEAHDARHGRKSWDDAATAVSLFNQADIFPVIITEPTRDLLAQDGLRKMHALAKELGAGRLLFVLGAHGNAPDVRLRVIDFVRARRDAVYSDYPAISMLGSREALDFEDGHVLTSLFAAPELAHEAGEEAGFLGNRPRIFAPTRPVAAEEPEPELTGMDLPEPAPGFGHRPKAGGTVVGRVADALNRLGAKPAAK